MVISTLLYGSETYVLSNIYIQAAEMTFSRYIRGCMKFGRIRNDVITGIGYFLGIYKNQGMYIAMKHIDRIYNKKVASTRLYYDNKGERDVGRPCKIWLEIETRTGHAV